MVVFCLYFVLTLSLTFVNCDDCPNICSCLGTYMDCSKKGLTKIPNTSPSWVDSLEFSNNAFAGDPSKSLAQLSELKELKLNKNSLKTLPLLTSRSLEKLYLSHNDLSSINYKEVEHLPSLVELDLSNNRFDTIEHMSFPHQNVLKNLNLNNNRIKYMNSSSFRNLTSLTELKLNRNRISHLYKEAFINLFSLNTLELNRNQLKEINGLAFQDLKNLTFLKLRKNQIREIKDGAFYGTKLSHLQLDYNSITTVHKAGFYGLSTLTTLSLSHNLISIINDSVWEFCKNIRELDLSNNQIYAIKKGTFENLANLEKLQLYSNDIALIEENAFFYTSKLTLLDLGNNKISWTIEDQNGPFVGLEILQYLSLASNNIKSIGEKAFEGLNSLIELDLTNNNITSVYENAFSVLVNIQQLHMNTSSLLCDCHLQWLNIWFQNHPEINVDHNRCSYPISLWGEPLVKLSAENLTCSDSPKPKIISEPKSQMVIKGDNVSLVCKASSSTNSSMVFYWKRDNFDIKNAEVTEFDSSPDGRISEATSELRLYNVNHDDAGKYQCIVENIFGKTYSTRSRIVVVTYPSFERIPKNITVKPGNTARLECSATGQPLPQVAWRKDGGNDFPAARERRMHIMPTDNVFFITNVKVADMGVYSCTAKNPAGMIVVNATLSIEEIPFFAKPMENKEVIVGDAIVIECIAAGTPKPTLRWLKDDGPIQATKRHFFTAEDQLLIITGTVMSDAGTYICELTNSVGSKRGSMKLNVNPVIDTFDNYMIGVIVISVVCCAVGTSIGWVVIIYHIRKRLKKKQNTIAEASPALMEEPHANVYTDAVSDHSSCKDSGTGDSDKRSNEIFPTDDFSIPIADLDKESKVNNINTLTHNSQHRHTNHKRSSVHSLTPEECISPLQN